MEKINEKLHQIQTELKVPKGQYNSFGKYKYRSCEDILEGVKPLLLKTGTTLTISDEIMFIGDRYYIKATVVLSDGKDTITTTGFAREEESKKGMDGSQVTGASSSYARKYALNGLFAIDDTKDSDTTTTGYEERVKEPANKIASETNEATATKEQIEHLKTLAKEADISEARMIAKYGNTIYTAPTLSLYTKVLTGLTSHLNSLKGKK